ncbi:MAG: hypothetical protein R2824_28310 [Saprospiraceae bacterium]
MRAPTPKDIRELAEFSAGLCISFYMPTQSVGQEISDHADHLVLKNQMKEVAKEMPHKGFSEKSIRDFLAPLHRLTDDLHFWRTRSKGLAIFLAADHLQYFHLPLSVEPQTYVGYEFYTKPLLPVISGNGTYFMLSLNLQQVEFFQVDRDALDQVILADPLPQNIEEVVGSDFKPRFHGVYGGKTGGHSHSGHYGQGEWQEDEKHEIIQFFRAVHEAIAPTLRSADLPLLLSGMDHLVALYRQVEDYHRLMPEALLLNPKDKSLEDLHRESWQLMAPHFDEGRLALAERVRQFRDTERVATNIQDVIPAAIGGRVEALFLDRSTEIWGTYFRNNAKTVVHTGQQPGNTSLTNLAANRVFLQGGQVFLLEREEMPLDYAPVNALFRF